MWNSLFLHASRNPSPNPGIGKEAKFERGAAQVGPGIGLDFPLPLLQCMHNNPGG